jgi:hypothetical protein
MCLVHGFGEEDKEGREREWNKQHQHRLANLKDASRGDQPFSAILREAPSHSDGREALNGLSLPSTDLRPREVSKNFSYRRHFKISYIIRKCSSFICYKPSLKFSFSFPFTSTQASTGGTVENSIPKSSPPSCPPSRPLIAQPKPTRTTPSHPRSPPSPLTNHGSSSVSQTPASRCSARTLGSWLGPLWAMRVMRGASVQWQREGGERVEGVKEESRGSSGEWKETKKQKQRKRQHGRKDRETTPRPSRESASVTCR